MQIQELTPGCKVDICIVQRLEKDAIDGNQQAIFLSSVFDVAPDDTIELQMPTFGGRFQLLPKNIRYQFNFSTEQGMYRADGTVIDHVKKDHFYLLKVALSTPLEKFQRRQYYRIPCDMPTIFMGITEEAAQLDSLPAVKEYMKSSSDMKVRGIGTILDISGGGARFTSSNSLKDVPYLLLQFHLVRDNREEDLGIDVVCRVIASERIPSHEKYMHRVKFYFKDSKPKEELIGFVFEEERRIRKKEQGI